MNMDPSMDGSFHINRGINQARMQVMELNRKGLPTALEFRDTITPRERKLWRVRLYLCADDNDELFRHAVRSALIHGRER